LGFSAVSQDFGLVQPPGVPVGGGEVVAGGQGVGVGVAQDPLAVGEGALVQRDGLVQPPGGLVGAGEVVAGGQGVGVGVAQDPLAVGEGALVQRDGLVQPPGGLVGAGEVVAGGQGVGVGVAQDPLEVGEGALEQRLTTSNAYTSAPKCRRRTAPPQPVRVQDDPDLDASRVSSHGAGSCAERRGCALPTCGSHHAV
jgi:hypothetical protein